MHVTRTAGHQPTVTCSNRILFHAQYVSAYTTVLDGSLVVLGEFADAKSAPLSRMEVVRRRTPLLWRGNISTDKKPYRRQ